MQAYFRNVFRKFHLFLERILRKIQWKTTYRSGRVERPVRRETSNVAPELPKDPVEIAPLDAKEKTNENVVFIGSIRCGTRAGGALRRFWRRRLRDLSPPNVNGHGLAYVDEIPAAILG